MTLTGFYTGQMVKWKTRRKAIRYGTVYAVNDTHVIIMPIESNALFRVPKERIIIVRVGE